MREAEFSEWARQEQYRLVRTAFLLCGDLHRAEDLVQDALVKVALRWERLRDGHPEAYARRVVVNSNISWWRRHRRETAADPREQPAEPPDTDTTLVVRRALARLTPNQRAVVVLRHLDDLTERETAEVLGVSIGTVKSQNAAALARLREGAPELQDLIGRTS
ncbi:MAG TPA: SigE family RNA polymerase sigma factor [Marmoricola sp.]|nr:SigE family RNA polymerase sigma factor [Marmoricola sp.]